MIIRICPYRSRGDRGFGWGGAVAPACGDMQVAASLMAARMVARLAAAVGPAGGGVFMEYHVPDVVMCLDGPVLSPVLPKGMTGS